MGFFSKLFNFFKEEEPKIEVVHEPMEELSEGEWYTKNINSIKNAISQNLGTETTLEMKNAGDKEIGILMLKHGGIHFNVILQSFNQKDKTAKILITTREKAKNGRILRYTADDFVGVNDIPSYVTGKAYEFAEIFAKEKAKLDNLKGYKLQKIEFDI